jgi:uncharacterized protein (TIGR03437 family)
MRRIASLLCAGLLMATAASGYYHFLHFVNKTAPFVPMPEKYDLGALRNNTVYYFISEEGPAEVALGDSAAGWISQIRLAAKIWNNVSSSALRVDFGGISSASTPQNAPGIDIAFDEEMPPGLAALGGITSVSHPAVASDGSPFVPITRGVVRLRRDLRESPSFGERAFMTVVHEFGHALGLQHTHTSGVMSTEVTRATSRAKPLSDDDVAAISLLYPTESFLARTGSITGRVTAGGEGLNMASVVAISANGPAISTLTLPDGTYTLRGIPPGSYFLYAHPLPPALTAEIWPGNVKPPQDPDGNLIPASGAFTTQFYPGTRDPGAAATLFVNSGETLSGMDFSVQRRAAPAVSSVTTYGYYGSNAIRPAPVVGNMKASALVATGTGLVRAPNQLAPGLSVRVLADSGASIPASSVKYYTSSYLRFDVYPGFGWDPGPRHLVFLTQDDVYVLPAGLVLVANQGPAIDSVTPANNEQGSPIAMVAGKNFDDSTRVFFDGIAAAVVARSDDSITVIPPPAPGGHRANVIAVNGDGQSSLFSQPGGGPAYTYASSDVPMISITPQTIPAGSEGMVEVIGSNTLFVQGQTVLGFGTSDVAVRRLWVLGPNRLLANVSVSRGAPVTSARVTVATGLDMNTAESGFRIAEAPIADVTTIVPPVTNAVNGNPGVWPGGIGVLNVSNLRGKAETFSLTVGDQKAMILTIGDGQITFQVPVSLGTGPAVVRLSGTAGEAVLPVVMQVDPPPPPILAAYSSAGVLADAANPARPGSIVGLLLGGLPESVLSVDPVSIKIAVGGVEHRAFSVAAQPGGVLIQFTLSPAVSPGAQVMTMVTYNGLTSQPYNLAVK